MRTSGNNKILPKILMIGTSLMLVGCADIIEKANRGEQKLHLTFVESGASIIKDVPAENVMFNALVCLEKDHNAQKAKLVGLLDLYGTPTNRHPALTPANSDASKKAYDGVELSAGAGNSYSIAVMKDDQVDAELMTVAFKKINGDLQKDAKGKAVEPEGLDNAVAELTLSWDTKNAKSVAPHYSGETDVKWGDSSWPPGGIADMGAVFLKTNGVKQMEKMVEVEDHIAATMPIDPLPDGMPNSLGACKGPFTIKKTETTAIDFKADTSDKVKELVIQLLLGNGNSTSIKAAESGNFSLEPKYFVEPDKGAQAKSILNEGETVSAILKLIRRYANLVGGGLTLTEVVEICHGYVTFPKAEAAKK